MFIHKKQKQRKNLTATGHTGGAEKQPRLKSSANIIKRI
jgi:hypothetical protein